MDNIETYMYRIKDSSTDTHKSFHNIFWSIGNGKVLNLIITHLYCTKYNEINIFHSVVQKHALCTGSHKRFLIHHGICFETAGNVL